MQSSMAKGQAQSMQARTIDAGSGAGHAMVRPGAPRFVAPDRVSASAAVSGRTPLANAQPP
jgi:hypothetical protein